MRDRKKGIFGYKRFLVPVIKPVCSSFMMSSVPHEIAEHEGAVPVPFRHRLTELLVFSFWKLNPLSPPLSFWKLNPFSPPRAWEVRGTECCPGKDLQEPEIRSTTLTVRH